jgi:hypothetical protein
MGDQCKLDKQEESSCVKDRGDLEACSGCGSFVQHGSYYDPEENMHGHSCPVLSHKSHGEHGRPGVTAPSHASRDFPRVYVIVSSSMIIIREAQKIKYRWAISTSRLQWKWLLTTASIYSCTHTWWWAFLTRKWIVGRSGTSLVFRPRLD